MNESPRAKSAQDSSSLDKPQSNCGIAAVYGSPEASHLVYLALYALQHRGQESSGIVSNDGQRVHRHVGQGLVADVFSGPTILDQLKGSMAIGHNRYSTTGSTLVLNAQPLLFRSKQGPFALSHNGNFTNSGILRSWLEEEGSLFQTTTDTEIVPHLVARSRKPTLTDKIIEALKQISGAYSLVMLSQDRIFAARDPHGVRPLCIGKKDDAYFVVSETCALDLVRAEYIRDVTPGELVEIGPDGIISHRYAEGKEHFSCVFEYIYFARPDSRIFNDNVDKVRRKLGKILALESPVDADIVISVPDSSNTAAVGFSRRSGMKFDLGLIRNHYVGRTFIQPRQKMRDFGVRVKFNTVRGILQNRRVVVVEDSIVRGTTLRQLVQLIRQAGATEVHVRVSSPPIISPCFYGMDFPSKEELIAAQKSVEEIRDFLKCDSLAYLSQEGLMQAVTDSNCGFCSACFTGRYPIPIEDRIGKYQHENEPER
ncbi:amidophosphoribosyltransferase [candidate division KSB1 bacterium]|nr:amidophosphoribosyltransferase [candidate division KSB1 bacterium]